MAETVNEGVDLELEAQSRSGVSGGSGEPRPSDPPSPSLLGQMYLTLSKKEAQESEAYIPYKLSECQREDINRPSEFEADDEADSDSPAQRRALQEASSSLGEFPALADMTRRIGTLAVDEKIGANNEPRDITDAITPAKESYTRRMIGDLDDSAGALLSLHEREANCRAMTRSGYNPRRTICMVPLFSYVCPSLFDPRRGQRSIDLRPSRQVYLPLLLLRLSSTPSEAFTGRRILNNK
jgi:hypothetical protein